MPPRVHRRRAGSFSVMLAGMSERAAELLQKATSNPGHRAGTDAERRTANELARELRGLGMEPEIEPAWVHPRWPLTHVLHCLLGATGSVLAIAVPVAGFALVLIAATSLYLDLSARWYLLRRLTFRRASQNVVAIPEEATNADADDLILLAADYDAPLTGAAFNKAPTRVLALIRRLAPIVSPSGIVFWSLAVLLPALGARMAGVEASWLSLLQLPPTIILIVAAFYYGEIALSAPSPAGNVNGAGVAATIRAAELVAETGINARLGVVLSGGGDCDEQGMRSFLRSNRERLAAPRTFVVGIEGGGVGAPRFAAAGAGPLTAPADRGLEQLAEALAVDDRLRRIRLVPSGTAAAAGRYGYPSIQLCAREGDEYLAPLQRTLADTPGACDADRIEELAGTAADLVRLLDRQLSRDRKRAAAEAASESE